MTETLKRIYKQAENYEIAKIESELLGNYYQHLISGIEPESQSDLIRFASVARKIASMWADLPRNELIKIPSDVKNPICVAPRIMYFVAELLDDKTQKTHWFREASIAYLQSCNVPGCRTAWARYQKLASERIPSDFLIDRILGNELGEVEWPEPKILSQPWSGGKKTVLEEANRQLYQLSCDAKFAEVFEKSLVYRLSSTLCSLGALSISRVFSKAGESLPKEYRRALVNANRMLLMPSQVPAIEAWLNTNGNFILCTPTSTGKTFVAEVAIVVEMSKLEKGISFFVTPYRAVARSICESLRERLSECGIDVVPAFGDGLVEVTNSKTIVVGTPEKIDGLLLAEPTLLQSVVVCIFDEIHLITQRTRGAFYESFIARVLLEQSLTGFPKRIMGISAVVENHDKLGTWFKTDEVVASDWRPNPIVESYWTSSDEILVFDPNSDLAEPKFFVFDDLVSKMPKWPSQFIPMAGMENALRKPLGERCRWYALNCIRKTGGPVLAICSSRAQTREFAQIFMSGLEEKLNDQIEQAVEEIEREFPFLSLLTSCLRRGVAYHNAALPQRVRHKIEDLLKERQISAVFATTTLAEGADFPFRAVIIAAPGHFDRESEEYAAMSPLLLRNIAGRGGRTSGQLVGDVIQMYSPHRLQDVDGEQISSEDVFTKYLVNPKASRVYSSISKKIEIQDTTSQTARTVFSSFDRVVNRWDSVDDAIAKHRKHFFDTPIQEIAGRKFEDQYEAIMKVGQGFDEPLALRASPLKLTKLGRVVLMSGFGVLSGGIIWQRLEELGWFEDSPSEEEIVSECALLGGRIPEVSELRVSNRRPLRDDNLAKIYSKLRQGVSLSDAYLLAEEDTSKFRTAKKLVVGEASDDDTIHARFEVFADELKRKLLVEIPSVAKAMKLFVEYGNPFADVAAYDAILNSTDKLRKIID